MVSAPWRKAFISISPRDNQRVERSNPDTLAGRPGSDEKPGILPLQLDE
jgi:hypothetical protein